MWLFPVVPIIPFVGICGLIWECDPNLLYTLCGVWFYLSTPYIHMILLHFPKFLDQPLIHYSWNFGSLAVLAAAPSSWLRHQRQGYSSYNYIPWWHNRFTQLTTVCGIWPTGLICEGAAEIGCTTDKI